MVGKIRKESGYKLRQGSSDGFPVQIGKAGIRLRMELQLIGTEQLMFEVQGFVFLAVAIFGVTSERSTDLCHMGTDLMRASGVQGNFRQTKPVSLL